MSEFEARATTAQCTESSRYNRPRQPEPDYTHELHAVRCGEAARQRQVLVQRVLAKRGPIVYCGVIKEPWTTPSGIDCWTLETSWPEKARVTIPVRNVIQCGGEFCSCAPADSAGGAPLAGIPAFEAGCRSQAFPDPAFSQAGVVAPPDGLNSEKTQVSAGT